MEELLLRYIKGEATEDEKRSVMLWIEQSPENMRQYMATRKLYDISLWNVTKDHNQTKKPAHKFNLYRIAIEFTKIAAILIICFMVTKQLFNQDTILPEMQTVYVPAGQRVELTLADGTKVWLNSHSTFRFPNHFTADARNVELDGEGYFTVQHNKKAPFTVQTGKYAIHVLGTEFNVKAYNRSNMFETSLLKGAVEISSPDMTKNLRLQPNEIAQLTNGKLTKQHIPDYNYFKWKDGLFCFENETIENLIEKMQLYYDVTIKVERAPLLQYRYSGKFRIKDGIEHVLKVLQLKHKFTYEKDDERNLITIK
ncbi:FecR family protein [Parabacteroides chinchillae]|uniref:FecR family protein n=1 Tax=Parabacteroides chinchillae TaxID=871327 RepID=A0A8G2BX61_9BACT|nr:FecR family protein [Parabacteroides chinchillae]SEF99601.1 FecR family protein [Parabacteroides chinchillae]